MPYSMPTETVPLIKDSDGVIRVAETRVTLDTVVAAFLDGATAEEITYQYSTLDLADVYSVIAYYLRERAEVDAYLQKRQAQAEEIRQSNEQRCDPTDIRTRLLARCLGGVGVICHCDDRSPGHDTASSIQHPVSSFQHPASSNKDSA